MPEPRSPIIDQERLSFREAATRLNVCLATVWRWCLNGVRGRKLRSIHVGGRRYILTADLEAFLTPADDPQE